MPTPIPPITASTLDTATRAMHADLVQVRTLANNLANATTPGFRREVSTTLPFSDLLSANAGSAVVNRIDHRSGPLQPTGRPLDVAVMGSGYLEVMTEHGVAYTRHGSLRVDAQGRLVAGTGHPVLGEGGEIRVDGEEVQVGRDGLVHQGERTFGRIRVVQFEHANQLKPLGQGLYASTGALPAAASSNPPVEALQIGYLEASNVAPATEMVRLTEVMRHFEALQRVVQGFDETLEKSIRKLGEL